MTPRREIERYALNTEREVNVSPEEKSNGDRFLFVETLNRNNN